MQYWTKNGSRPSTETDGTEGWQQAPAPSTDAGLVYTIDATTRAGYRVYKFTASTGNIYWN